MSADAATLNEIPAPEVDAHDPPSRWKLLASTLRDQRRNLIIGSLIGLLWMVGKISVPLLVRFSIDRGIEEGERLWLWVGLIVVAAVLGVTNNSSEVCVTLRRRASASNVSRHWIGTAAVWCACSLP